MPRAHFRSRGRGFLIYRRVRPHKRAVLCHNFEAAEFANPSRSILEIMTSASDSVVTDTDVDDILEDNQLSDHEDLDDGAAHLAGGDTNTPRYVDPPTVEVLQSLA